jgi:hypothetical protein
MIASLVSSRFVFSFRPWGQAWPEEEVPSRLRLSPKVSSPAMGMGAVAAFHYAEERRRVCRPAYTRNPIRRQSSPALRLIRARTRWQNLIRLGGRCREVALRVSACGAGIDLEPMWAPKRRNNHRQAHFIAAGQTVRAADLFCDPRCHDSLRTVNPSPIKGRLEW